jgi:hypothetical protein
MSSAYLQGSRQMKNKQLWWMMASEMACMPLVMALLPPHYAPVIDCTMSADVKT